MATTVTSNVKMLGIGLQYVIIVNCEIYVVSTISTLGTV